MLIVCPNCQSSYRVSAESLGAAGRTVRCAKCNTAWFAEPGEDDGQPVDAAAVESTAMVAEARDGDNLYGASDPSMTRLANVMASIRSEQQDVVREAIYDSHSGKSRTRRLRSPVLGVVVLLAVICGGLILARGSIVRMWPQTAQLYAQLGLDVNLRGLAFRDIDASERVEGGVPILLVSGKVENITNGVINVPRLRLAVRNTEGREIYVWTVVPRRNRLVGGDSLSFQAQLASPPAESSDIAVRFLARQDAVAGIQ
jgi:predicted Zn finger-like uncharacterized protein